MSLILVINEEEEALPMNLTHGNQALRQFICLASNEKNEFSDPSFLVVQDPKCWKRIIVEYEIHIKRKKNLIK